MVPEDYNYWLTVRSSGWSGLAPFTIDKERRILSRVQKLTSGKIVHVTIVEKRRGTLTISTKSKEELDAADVEELENVVETCLTLNEDLSPFYALLEEYPEFRWVVDIGAGHSVRSPTVFEDVVKTISSTNCSWALTKAITRRLCEKLGEGFQGMLFTFPTAQQVASKNEDFIRREIRAGYRSPYLVELARKIVDGDLDVEARKGSPLDSVSLKREVMGIKGVGSYAADNILKLLGRYDFLALDSWGRKRFSLIHKEGDVASDREIEDFYTSFGKWKGLVFSLDMTKEYLNP